MHILMDTHTHTVASGHAYSTLEENVRQAAARGLKLIAITDHGPAIPDGTGPFHFRNFSVIPQFLEGVEVIMGAELSIMDFHGSVDLPEEILKLLNLVIASYHPPCLKGGTMAENTAGMLAVMENPYIDIIGHPGDPKYPLDITAVVNTSVRTGTLLEINNMSVTPGGSRAGSRENMVKLLKYCRKRDMPVILGSDAHFSTWVGEFTNAIALLEEIQFPEELVLNASIEAFKKALVKKR